MRTELPVSLPSLRDLARPATCDLVSSDLFDTVLLRDASTETQRFAEAGRRAAATLGLDPTAVISLRWTLQASAYRAVAIERPAGEATLATITRTMATAFGLGPAEAEVFRDAEVRVDIRHLRPNRALLELFGQIRSSGVPVIAVSDTYYSEADLRQLLASVVGDHPFRAIYSSADLDATKHAGSIFRRVAEVEDVNPSRVVHVGDSTSADVTQARLAGWMPVHLPRGGGYEVRRRVGQLRSVPLVVRRAR